MAFPAWRHLYHFATGVLHIEFSDGSKYEDLSKVCMLIFAITEIYKTISIDSRLHLLPSGDSSS